MVATTDSPSSPQTLKVVTHNCWGLKFISKFRHERLSRIGEELAALKPAPDIVGLQECWTQADFASICESTKSILPFAKYYFSGIFGGGLAILSRWPIEESNMVRYPLNGRPAAFYRGDWYVGKGVATARIRSGPTRNDIIEVFCTHLHAPYEAEPYDSYMCHRTAQAWEIAKLMRNAGEKGHLVLGLGDFNMKPGSLAHAIISTHGRVRDVWQDVYPDSSLGAAEDDVEKQRKRPMPDASFNIRVNGTTCDSVLNTWRWNKGQQKRLSKGEDIEVPDTSPDPRGKRLDYIFVGGENLTSLEPWKVDSVNIGMTERHPTLKCSLSDHFSVEAVLSRTPSNANESSVQYDPSEDHDRRAGPKDLAEKRHFGNLQQFLSVSTYDEILKMLQLYVLRERRQRRWRLGHFIGQIGVSIGCLVAVWWSPRNFVAFILMLVSTLGLSAGVIDGLMGGLFVGSELRALKEFEWEISSARQRALAMEAKDLGNRQLEGTATNGLEES